MAVTVAPTTGVVVPRSELARALRAAASVKSKGLLINLDGEAVQVVAHTWESAVAVDLDAAIGEPSGSILVARPLFAGLMAYCDHEIALSINADGSEIKVASGDSEFDVRAMRPLTPATDGSYGHDLTATADVLATFEAPVLVETLRRVLPFASRDMTRPILATVALYPTANCAVSTDSYRLAVVRYGDDGPDEDPIIFNLEGATSLQRMLVKQLGTVEIAATDSHYLVDFDGTRWSLRRPNVSDDARKRGNGGYPNWRKLLPDTDPDCTLKVDREDLLNAARAAGVVAGNSNAPLKLKVAKKQVSVTAESRDTATMTRRLGSAEITGNVMEIGLNPQFVGDICATAPVERLTVKLIAPRRPIMVEAARDVYLLMPIRLDV